LGKLNRTEKRFPHERIPISIPFKTEWQQLQKGLVNNRLQKFLSKLGVAEKTPSNQKDVCGKAKVLIISSKMSGGVALKMLKDRELCGRSIPWIIPRDEINPKSKSTAVSFKSFRSKGYGESSKAAGICC
jgi:hypothetical protein